MPRRTGKFAFDMGLDYEETRAKIGGALSEARKEAPNDLIPKKRLTHYSILLTQLVNGTRVSEGFDAVKGWGLNGKREQQVQVRKLGRKMKCDSCALKFSVKSKTNSPSIHTQKTGHVSFSDSPNLELRLALIPSECLDSDRAFIFQAIDRGLTVGSVKVFALRNLHLNTHALRYAKITSLSSQGQPAQIVSKITHHKNLNFIVDYTSQKQADDILRKSVS